MNIVKTSSNPRAMLASLRESGMLVITLSEAASALDVDPRTVKRMIEDGEIFAIRSKATVRIPLDRFLAMFSISDCGTEDSCEYAAAA